MQQFIMDAYSRSRIDSTKRSLARAADEWAPPARGPAFRDRVGMALVSAGASLLSDRRMLERLEAPATSRAA